MPNIQISGRVSVCGCAIKCRKGCPSNNFSFETQAIKSLTFPGNCSLSSLLLGFNARAVLPSEPGALPRPKSILFGAIASNTLNCSATLNGA